VASKAADTDACLSVQAGVVADPATFQIDTAIQQTTGRGRGKAAMNLADQQKQNRTGLVASRTTEAGKLASLKVEKAEVEGERRSVVSPLQHPCYLHKHPGPR